MTQASESPHAAHLATSPTRDAGSVVDSPAAPAAAAVSLPVVWLCGAVLALAIVAVYFHAADGYPLTEPDEARYAEIGREMLERGEWITPHLNYVKYFEKPPLVYWATAASFAALGTTELAARLPSLLSGIGTVALTVWLAARMFNPATALLVLPIIAAGPLFGFMATTILLDTSLAFWMTLAMTALWFGALSESAAAATRWYRAAYAATALAVLVKGPVAAVLVAGSAALFLALHGGWRAVRRAVDWRGILLAIAIIMPWFIAVSWRNPEFVHFFVVDQHIARYLWTTEHGEPIWFFLPVLPLALAPWSFVLLLDPPLLRDAPAPRTWSPATRYLVIWAAVIAVFFSLSTSKLLTYVLPAIPPLAILTARALLLGVARMRTAGLSRLAFGCLFGGPVLGLCGALLPLFIDHWRMGAVAPYLLAGGPLVIATGWGMRRALAGGRSLAALAVLSVGWMAVFFLAVSGRGVANNYRDLGLAVRAAARPEDRVALFGSFTQGIGFYSARRVVMVRSFGELKFGAGQGDQSAWFWPNVDQLRSEWAGPGRLLLVINRTDLEAMSPPLQPEPIVLAKQRHKVLVANR